MRFHPGPLVKHWRWIVMGTWPGASRKSSRISFVDASGPFQAYGKDPYRVVKAALAHAHALP